MTSPLRFPTSQISPVQATELALLVDLEARWENLRLDQSANRGKTLSREELKQIQMAYEAFHGKLVVYNARYKPAHVPELLLNTAFRFQLWCRSLKGLFLVVLQNESPLNCPVHLLEKAYRCADRIADRANKERFARPPLSESIAATVQDLGNLASWCDGLIPIAAAS
jgi:hypothetical protein